MNSKERALAPFTSAALDEALRKVRSCDGCSTTSTRARKCLVCGTRERCETCARCRKCAGDRKVRL